MPDLSEEDLQAAAREAGVTPLELRQTLYNETMQNAGPTTALAPTSPRAPAKRGDSAAAISNRLASPPDDAAGLVREQLARQIGHAGQGTANKADIFDEKTLMTYRVSADGDGSGGSLVRVDVDPIAANAKASYAKLILGGSVAFGVATLLTFGFSIPLLGIAAVGGTLGAVWLGGAAAKKRSGLEQARQVASTAVLAAEDSAARALAAGQD